ncbi:protein NYNRIN-like [Grus japonensis]|uniref:Gypsy retrotransposon integrase-like protein 1 n=1 Tax=Grus japonensis TaxID=30415 RepID=A0ABC9WRQ0_GRUJA
MLIDTGASYSILNMAPGEAGIFQTSEIIELTGPNGQKSSVPFTGPVPFEIGTAKGSEKFGKMEMKGKPGILAISALTKMGVVVDLANQVLLHCPQSDAPVIPASHRVMSVKAPELLVHPEWEPRVKRVTEQFPQVWARSKLDCGQIDTVVAVKGPDPPPQPQPQYPAEAEDGLWDTVKTLLEQGVLVEQQSTSNAPVWPLRKADGKTWRLTVDFGTLNRVTPLRTSAVAKYPDIMAAISQGSEWFSVLSLTSPSFAIPLHPESWHKFAFTLRGRQFAFTRVPPGFHNAPAICHAHVARMWEKLSHRESVLSCAGDILIHTQTKEENLEVLAEVLEAVQKTGFRISPPKAQLCWKEVSYLGVTLGEEGRSLEKQRVELIQKVSAPADATTLRSFLALLRFSREFVEGYAEKAAPLCHLLKKDTPWEWGPEQDEAVKTLKESVAQAPVLACPQGDRPYVLQLASTGRGLQATLSQQHSAHLLPIAHASRLLTPAEQQFTDYEREVLALTWALQHWEYLVGSAPVLLRISRTPVRYLLSGKGDTGPLRCPRMANWVLALTNKEVPGEAEVPSPGTYGVVISAERDGQEPGGPPDEPKLRRAPLFESSLSLAEAKEKGYAVWFVDGSNYHEEGVLYTGYAAINHDTGEVVKGKCLPHSIQAAELVAVTAALENTPADQPLAIFSDSGWVVRAVLEWLPLWRERDMQSADGKPVTYAKKLLYLTRLAEQRLQPAQIIKVKAHKKGTEEAKWNREADAKAKQGAKEGLMWKANKPLKNGPVLVAPSRHWESVDLLGLQAQDPSIWELVQSREYKGCKVWKDVSGLVLARREGADFPVWVVPELVRTELVALAHEQGHLGTDKTMVRLQGAGWWPEMREDVERYVSNCLMCAANNPDAKTSKALLGHQRISGPWSKLQMEFIGPLPQTAQGNRYCLVISDNFTKWVEAFPARNNTASATAKILVEHIFSRWGIPKEIDSDHGQRFIGEVTKGVCQALGIKQKLHITGHFQKPGSAEGPNQPLKMALRKLVNQQRKDWDQKLPLVLLALRGAVASQAPSPQKLPPARDLKLLGHWWQRGEPPDELQPRVLTDRWVQDVLRTVSATYHQLASVQDTNIPKMDKQLGVLLHPVEWNMGDLVMYRGVREKNEVLGPQWMGPVRVVNKASPSMYQVEIRKGAKRQEKWFHSSQLKAWKGN